MSDTTERPRPPSGGWLFGTSADLLWGAGLAYVLLFAGFMVSGARMMSVLPAWFMMFLVIFLSVPHYGATLLRAYEREEDRRLYRRYTVHTTVALVLFFLWGLRDSRIGSLLFTLYITWSPWHYSTQNYGISLMFLGRRGVEVDPRTKRLLRLSIRLSFWISFLYMHAASNYRPQPGAYVMFLSLKLPAVPTDVVLFASLLFYGVTTLTAVAALARKGLRSSAPAILVLFTQFVWFVVPSVVKNWFPYAGPEIFHPGNNLYALIWLAIGHSVQYLWITAYFARATGQVSSTLSFYGRTVLCGCAVWAVPPLLFAPGLLGKFPYDLGLASVTAAAVNVHHFILDGALWKLRKARVGGVLMGRSRTVDEMPRRLRPLARPLVAAGVVSFAVLLFGVAEEQFGLLRELSRGDIAGAEASLDRLAWIGKDSSRMREALAARRWRDGELEAAERQLQIGVKVFPTASGWIQLGWVRGSQGKSHGSIDAYREALVLDPGNVTAKLLLGLVHADLGETAEAEALLEQCDRKVDDTPTMRSLRVRLEGALGAVGAGLRRRS
jgi:hypothetical protein